MEFGIWDLRFRPDRPLAIIGALLTTARLARALTFRDLVVYGLLFIGPLAPVGVFGVLDARTSGAVALTIA